MSEIKSKPFFDKLGELDDEILSCEVDCNHSVISDVDSIVGLAVDKHDVNITKYVFGKGDGISQVSMTREAFDKLYKLYKLQKEIL